MSSSLELVASNPVAMNTRAPLPLSDQELDEGYKYSLISILQSSLDIEIQLEVLSSELSVLLGPHSLRYQHSDSALDITIGSPSRHQLTYRLVLMDAFLGEITVFRQRPFNKLEISRFEEVLAIFIHTLRNALLYQSAIDAARTDPVTGARNRQALDETLERDISLTRRQQSELALLMLDADYFKRINDNYGHLAGDTVLRGLVDCISHCVRNSDVIFRYGGEEFTIILQNTDLDGAMRLAERIRQRIEAYVCEFDRLRIKVTASIGVSVLAETDTMEQLIERADNALYQAKQQGRNQVCRL